jgi:hypothetical protein
MVCIGMLCFSNVSLP